MANPLNIANRYRYAVLALLVIVTAAYGYYLFRTYWPKPVEASNFVVQVAVEPDGAVRIDGLRFDTADKLKPKIAAIQQAHGKTGFNIVAPRGDSMMPTAKAVVLLQNSGAKQIWVLTDPQRPAP